MKNIYLASSVDCVAKNIADKTNGKYKKIAFIITASEAAGEDLKWRDTDRNALIEAGFELTDYSVTGKSAEEIKEFLADYDGLVMEGGNTFYLLKQIQGTGCADILRDFVNSEKLYIGSSAGSIVAGPNIYPTYSKEEADRVPDLKDFEGLNLTDLVIQPHWGSEIFRESYLTETMPKAYSGEYKMILLSDSQYVAIEDRNIYRIIDIK